MDLDVIVYIHMWVWSLRPHLGRRPSNLLVPYLLTSQRHHSTYNLHIPTKDQPSPRPIKGSYFHMLTIIFPVFCACCIYGGSWL